MAWPASSGISPFVNPVVTRRNIGSSQFDGVNFSLEKRFSNHWASRVSYAIGYARGNSEANQTADNNYQVLGDPQLDRNFGPLNGDRRQNFVLSGRVEVPRTGGLTVSGVYRYLSGRADVADQLGGGCGSQREAVRSVAGRPLLRAGHRTRSASTTTAGATAARGPSYQQTDMRFGYRLRPRRQTRWS